MVDEDEEFLELVIQGFANVIIVVREAAHVQVTSIRDLQVNTKMLRDYCEQDILGHLNMRASLYDLNRMFRYKKDIYNILI